MAVTVDEVTMAKSGKSRRVKLSGSWYGSYMDSKIEMVPIGSVIEAEIVTLDKGGPWIKAWKAATNAAPPPSQVLPATYPKETTREREPQYAEPAKPGTVAPWWGPMCSNVLAHAIAAGILKTPNEVNVWYRAVKMAAEHGQSPSNDSEDSSIPF